MLPFELTKDTPYLALSGELWSVFYEYFNRNWSCYKGFLLYHVIADHTLKKLLYVQIVSSAACQWTCRSSQGICDAYGGPQESRPSCRSHPRTSQTAVRDVRRQCVWVKLSKVLCQQWHATHEEVCFLGIYPNFLFWRFLVYILLYHQFTEYMI